MEVKGEHPPMAADSPVPGALSPVPTGALGILARVLPQMPVAVVPSRPVCLHALCPS
jgi:hypothetical protein